MNKLTYSELGELYRQRTGKSPHTTSLEFIYKWALTQPYIKRCKDSSLEFAEVKIKL